MGFFFAAHGGRLVFVRVPQSGFLNDLTALQEDFLLAPDFIFQGTFDMFKRVQIFKLRAGAEGLRILGAGWKHWHRT